MDNPAVQSVLAAQQSSVQAQIQTAIASKQLSAARQQGAALVQLITAAGNISKAIGSGANFDAHA
jgi:hypothetical protein